MRKLNFKDSLRTLAAMFICMAVFLSCSTMVRPKLSSDINYQKDIKVKVSYYDGGDFKNEETFQGTGVVDQAPKYKVKIYPPGKADMITFTSCHREHKIAKPKKGWFKDYHEFEIELVRNLETNRVCGIEMGVYEKEKGRHGWASFAIESDKRKMPAHVKCNGDDYKSKGTSYCQAKKGLIQSIKFEKRVLHTKIAGCHIKASKDGKYFEYVMPEGECVIVFFDELDERNSHKHIMYGYDTIPIRGVD